MRMHGLSTTSNDNGGNVAGLSSFPHSIFHMLLSVAGNESIHDGTYLSGLPSLDSVALGGDKSWLIYCSVVWSILPSGSRSLKRKQLTVAFELLISYKLQCKAYPTHTLSLSRVPVETVWCTNPYIYNIAQLLGVHEQDVSKSTLATIDARVLIGCQTTWVTFC